MTHRVWKSEVRGRRSDLNGLAARDPEAVEDRSGRVGFIEGVEMNSGDVVVEEIVALLEREVDADARDHLRIGLTALKRAKKFRGEPRATGQLGDPLAATHGSDRHNTGDNRDADAGQFAAFPEIVEVAVIEKELGNDVICAGVDFRFQVVHFDETIRSGRVAFGKTGHADAEPARIGMDTAFVETPDESHEVGRVLERVL